MMMNTQPLSFAYARITGALSADMIAVRIDAQMALRALDTGSEERARAYLNSIIRDANSALARKVADYDTSPELTVDVPSAATAAAA